MHWIIHRLFQQEPKQTEVCLVCQRQKTSWTTSPSSTPPKTGAYPWWAFQRRRRSSRSDGRSTSRSTRKRTWSTRGMWIPASGGSPILFRALSSPKRASSRVRWSASMTVYHQPQNLTNYRALVLVKHPPWNISTRKWWAVKHASRYSCQNHLSQEQAQLRSTQPEKYCLGNWNNCPHPPSEPVWGRWGGGSTLQHHPLLLARPQPSQSCAWDRHGGQEQPRQVVSFNWWSISCWHQNVLTKQVYKLFALTPHVHISHLSCPDS